MNTYQEISTSKWENRKFWNGNVRLAIASYRYRVKLLRGAATSKSGIVNALSRRAQHVYYGE